VACHSEDFDCSRCTEAAKKERGCHEPAKRPVVSIGGEKYYRCPVKLIRPWAKWVLGLYRHYRDGHLPYSGGVMDQPAKLMEAFLVVASAIEEETGDKVRNPHSAQGQR